MSKTLFVVLCLIGLSLSIRINHRDDAPAPQPAPETTETPTTPEDATPTPAPTPSPEELKAYQRFMAFVMRDNSLRKVFTEGGQPNDIQLQKIVGFMINDEFFRAKMIKDMIASEGNEWIGDLSESAQIRFLRIITSVPPSKLENDKVMKTVINRLLKDKEIGPALKNKFGNDVSADEIKNILSEVGTDAVSVAAHHASVAYARWFKS